MVLKMDRKQGRTILFKNNSLCCSGRDILFDFFRCNFLGEAEGHNARAVLFERIDCSGRRTTYRVRLPDLSSSSAQGFCHNRKTDNHGSDRRREELYPR